MRLGRVLAGLMPKEPEVHGLIALMELQASRFRARVGADGTPVPLAEQDRSRWDRLLIQRGLAALECSLPEDSTRPRGVYSLQAGIAAEHAVAVSTEDTDWRGIAALYEELARRTGSPVVELNRAVAVSMALGPGPALTIVDALCDSGALEGYHLLPTVRADLLERLGRVSEARMEYAKAADLTRNERERDLLLDRS